jgi:hypothetical protein
LTAAVARFLRETILELNAWTGFAGQFSQLSEGTARFENLPISITEVLPAESCNTGPEPLVRAQGCVVFPLDGDPVVLTWAHLRVMRAATSGRAPLASADNATSYRRGHNKATD